MDSNFDIFGRLPNGKPVWIERLEGLTEAKLRLSILALIYPGEYFIYSVKDGGTLTNTRSDRRQMREDSGPSAADQGNEKLANR